MSFLNEILEQVSTEAVTLGDGWDDWMDDSDTTSMEAYKDLQAMDLTMESKSNEIVRGVGLYKSIESIQAHYEDNISMESHGNYMNAIESAVLASGLDIPISMFVSFEADDVAKDATADPGDAKTDDTKDTAKSDERKKKMDARKDKVKDTLVKIKEWLIKKAREFGEWIKARGVKIGALKNKIMAESASNDQAFKEA